jgi:hypothetical protein
MHAPCSNPTPLSIQARDMPRLAPRALCRRVSSRVGHRAHPVCRRGPCSAGAAAVAICHHVGRGQCGTGGGCGRCWPKLMWVWCCCRRVLDGGGGGRRAGGREHCCIAPLVVAGSGHVKVQEHLHVCAGELQPSGDQREHSRSESLRTLRSLTFADDIVFCTARAVHRRRCCCCCC